MKELTNRELGDKLDKQEKINMAILNELRSINGKKPLTGVCFDKQPKKIERFFDNPQEQIKAPCNDRLSLNHCKNVCNMREDCELII